MYKRIFVLCTILGMFVATSAHAAQVPEVFINGTTGSTAAQLSIMGADPNAQAFLYYQANGTTHSVTIGTTNASGNMATTIDAATYGILGGSQIYVTVDGAGSAFATWPDYTRGGSLPLNPTNLTLLVGQSGTVTASVSASLTLGSNSMPNVATATISGQQVMVKALTTGSDNISICANGLGCSTIGVTVTSSNGSNITAAAFSISTDTGNGSQVTLGLGQTLSVPLLGSAAHFYSISSNSNPTVIGASVNGTNLLLTGTAYGGANIQVCEFEGQCANIYAYVPTQTSTPSPTPAPTPTPTAAGSGSTPHVVFSTYLKPGSVGAQVRALQTILVKLGYLKHAVTGYYGTHTVDAVAALQKKHNLAALGVVGPATRKLLNSLPK